MTEDRVPTLPPCPICGKRDLFTGTDGRIGCPHCEVAVRLTEDRVPTHVHVIPLGYGHREATEGDTYSLVQCRECGEMLAIAPGAVALSVQPAPPLDRTTVQNALDEAWLESHDARELPRPPDLAEHLYEALTDYSAATQLPPDEPES